MLAMNDKGKIFDDRRKSERRTEKKDVEVERRKKDRRKNKNGTK